MMASACRLLLEDTCGAWCDCARFCFREGDVDKGEECLRQALSREPADMSALVTLACVYWYKFGANDPIYIDDALAVRNPLVGSVIAVHDPKLQGWIHVASCAACA